MQIIADNVIEAEIIGDEFMDADGVYLFDKGVWLELYDNEYYAVTIH